MDRIGRFVGEQITIDGIEGLIYGVAEDGWFRIPPHSHFKDSHYRFIWKEGNKIGEMIVSGKGLIPAEDYVPHDDSVRGVTRRMSFKTRERPGLVGRVMMYEFEVRPAVLKIKRGSDTEETICEIPVTVKDDRYELIRKYEGYMRAYKYRVENHVTEE
ncbi:hypothetical protein HZA97_01520 [Candidatus Woesearchaeota archaeon]|nr:hypothetical protein [Candidatus Woesearchaeota archaeon]